MPNYVYYVDPSTPAKLSHTSPLRPFINYIHRLRKMDFLKKVANQHQGNAATQPGDAAVQQTNPAAGSEQEDYVDKGNLETPRMING